jgi:hypothetical protein
MQLKRRGPSLNQLKNDSDIDYSSFGGTKAEPEAPKEAAKEPEVDYSEFGGTPSKPAKEKVGKFKSTLLGLYEGILAIPAVSQYGINELSKAFEGEGGPELSFEKENPLLAHLGKLPESEGQTARRLRVAGQVIPLAATGGIPGIVAGLVGSQAGQTIREVYGEEGKFEHFGWGEGAALATDILTGGAASVGTSIARKGAQVAAQEAPSIFRNAQTGLQRKVTQNAMQAEGNALQDIVNNFSKTQLNGFEEEALKLSPNRFTQMTQSNASSLKSQADNMFRNTQLNIISPIAATPEQGGRAIQEAANTVFQQEVIGAERQAYTAARESSEGLSGQAPRTLEEARTLRDNLTTNTPTPEQKPVIAFLDGLIADLETSTPETTTAASRLLDASGEPITKAAINEGVTEATTKSANELVDLVQRSNQAVNYGGEVRNQSHRLSPLIATLREEVGEVLAQKPEAANLYREANLLHARNAEIWGTKYMRNVRFSENPESIIGSTKKASNMRNLKQGVQDPRIQGLAERMVVGSMTEGGSAKSNTAAINNLSPELSPNARTAAQQLIDVKDPLTTTGGRTAVRNDILKDAAQSVNTGKRPEKILDLMQTPKGYQMVREAMNGSTESRELFKTFERLFLEDFVTSITDKSGVIDFKKATEIFKNPEMRNVLQQMGGDSLIRKFEQLEGFARNFEKNIALYSKPETQSVVKGIIGGVKNNKILSAGIITALLHSLHMPWPVITGLGLAVGTAKVAKISYNAIQKKILSNPKAVHYLEKVSQATTPQELAKQLPRLIAELDLKED